MKILWVKSDFLHPTTKGGHIRTLEMLRDLHQRHEIHYVAFDEGGSREGLERAVEYSTKAYGVPFVISPKGSARFYFEVLTNLLSRLPIHVTRPRSAAMRKKVAELMRDESFDALVCDFLSPCLNLPDLPRWVLFQHNVEVNIWQRHAQNASSALGRFYYGLQADRLFRLERDICRTVRRVIAVSDADAAFMREQYGVTRVAAVPTGVDVQFFARPQGHVPAQPAHLVFVGSMDWSPNVDGIGYFVKEILPLIRRERPDCTLEIVGRDPSPAMRKLAEADPLIRVRGTVPDVRPYLWDAQVSIVPLRIGGGTRLKIYEAMAAGVPVVSTTIGAEGLDVQHGQHIILADDPAAFAAGCLQLLNDAGRRQRLAGDALQLVGERFSWAQVARRFEELLAGA